MIDNTEARNRNMTPIRDNAVRSFKPDRCKAGRAQQSKLLTVKKVMSLSSLSPRERARVRAIDMVTLVSLLPVITLPGAMPPRFPPCFISTLSSINTVNFGEPS